jgi:hypothetical protein
LQLQIALNNEFAQAGKKKGNAVAQPAETKVRVCALLALIERLHG